MAFFFADRRLLPPCVNYHGMGTSNPRHLPRDPTVVVRKPDDESEEITWEAVLHPLTTSEGDPVALS